MIQFQILSGRQAGKLVTIKRLPCLVGRGAEANLRLDDAGVWDQHVEITFDRRTGFLCRTQAEASLLLNHEKILSGVLRNGDLIETGSVQMRFWLTPGEPQSTRFREALTWTALVALFGVQAGLICWLMR